MAAVCIRCNDFVFTLMFLSPAAHDKCETKKTKTKTGIQLIVKCKNKKCIESYRFKLLQNRMGTHALAARSKPMRTIHISFKSPITNIGYHDPGINHVYFATMATGDTIYLNEFATKIN